MLDKIRIRLYLLAQRFGKNRKSSYEIDMCNGPLLSKIIKFSIPLVLSSVLQLLFHSADIIVVGQYSGPTALAAVGATGALTNMFITVFMGLSVGTNVLTARYYAAKKFKDLSEVVHTSVAISVLFGIALFFLGLILAPTLLSLMDTPQDVIGQASLYMRILFLGMPALLLYNFGAAILRAMGDTRRPLYFLSISGVVNVLINLFLVVVIGLGVEGVAIATVVSQYLSAAMVVNCLVRSGAVYAVVIKQVRVHKTKLIEILKIGLPAGLQGAMFTFSNVLIQSSINSFGSVVVAGNTAAANLEGFIFVSLNSFHQTAVTFVSQNMGAKKYSRIPKIAALCLTSVVVIGATMGGGFLLFATPLLSMYNSDPDVLIHGVTRLSYICATYFLCGTMDVIIGILRGMGYSMISMITSTIGVCGVRIVWIYTVFSYTGNIEMLFVSYPVTWALTAVVSFFIYLYAYNKLPKEQILVSH